MKRPIPIFIVILLTAGITSVYSQNKPELVAGIPVNYDESLTGSYSLPDILTLSNGRKVNTVRQWEKKRRAEILSLFESRQYGKLPPAPVNLPYEVYDKGSVALDGRAVRKQVRIFLADDTANYRVDLLVYLPAGAKGAVPVFLQIGFMPNAATVDDPGIRGGFTRGRDGKLVPVSRKGMFGKVDPGIYLSQGIGFATVYYGDIEPDFGDGIKYGIRGSYLKEGQDYPAADEWGAISAWSWGLSRVMDYLVKDKDIDAGRVALFGVSRLGKTALWTGCRDSRFALVIASCSGEGGAALSRRWYGETIDHMTHPTRYFYQFAGNWRNYKDDPSQSPVDAHMLIALMAPRPLLLQTGDSDNWSDPKGEFLAAVAAGPVYELYGKSSLGTDIFPPAGTPILNDLAYFMHSGGHGAMPADYEIFIKYMKLHGF